MKILVMGLPGSGKTTLAEVLAEELKCVHYNADKVRAEFNDWDFSCEGRLRQAHRMSELANQHEIAVCDFVCPTKNCREAFAPDFLIWVNRIEKGRFEDTNKLFEPPSEWDFKIDLTWKTPEQEVTSIVKKLKTVREKNAIHMDN